MLPLWGHTRAYHSSATTLPAAMPDGRLVGPAFRSPCGAGAPVVLFSIVVTFVVWMQKSVMDRKLVSQHPHKGDHIGRSLHRLEDRRFLTGQGRYVNDVALLGQLHGVVLRSPHGHALIEGIDDAAARAMPGVSGIFTAADLDADGIGTLPCRRISKSGELASSRARRLSL